MLALFEQLEDRQASEAELAPVRQGVWSDIVAQALVLQLVITGIRPGGSHSEIIELGLLQMSAADFTRNSLMTDIGVFVAVMVHPPVLPPSTPAEPVSDAVTARGKGGRAPSHDWNQFIKEVVRFALLDGFNTRRELTAHMNTWCAEHWLNPPTADAVRKKVLEICPDEVPAE